MDSKIVDFNGKERLKLGIYGAVSALSFLYLATPAGAAAGVFAFALLQFAALWFIVRPRRRFWAFIPITVLSLNFFISGSDIWHIPNFIICAVLFSAMFTDFKFSGSGWGFIADILQRTLSSVRYFSLPFKWGIEASAEKASLIKRVLKAVAVTIPAALILIVLLSCSDMIFLLGTTNFLSRLIESVDIEFLLKALFSIAVGLFLFGVVCSGLTHVRPQAAVSERKTVDLLAVNIFLGCILFIYTVFVVIQFRYLFTGAELPYGLSYTEYARKGFFELLLLSAVNICLILFASSNSRSGSRAAGLTKGLNCYLCFVTFVLLASSFYRMTLYCGDDGLTRLRLFVLGFLVFEAVGLAATLVYILRPRFNIILVYCCIGLVYYMLLNIVPVDYFVAKSQIDRYQSGLRTEIDYVYTLSSDAAPQVARLAGDSSQVMYAAEYFRRCTESEEAEGWQGINLSKRRGAEIRENLAADGRYKKVF